MLSDEELQKIEIRDNKIDYERLRREILAMHRNFIRESCTALWPKSK